MARMQLSSSRSLKDGNLYGYTLPRGLINLAIRVEDEQYTLEAGEVVFRPDLSHQYYLNYAGNNLTDDEITVRFTPDGFLRQVHTLVDDQTDQVLDSLIEIGTGVAQIATGMSTRTRSLPQQKTLFEGEVDPFDAVQMAELNTLLQKHDPHLQLVAQMVEDGQEGAKATLQATQGQTGFYYKPFGTCNLSLSYAGGQMRTSLQLPHPNRLAFMKIPQAKWVKTEFRVEFDDRGYPVEIYLRKPSTMLEAVRLPLNIMKALINLPAQLFQFRVNLQQQRTAAQQADLAYERELGEVRRQMETLRTQQQKEEQTRNLEVGEGTARPVSASGSIPQTSSSHGDSEELQNTILKLQQDVMILRKRINADQSD